MDIKTCCVLYVYSYMFGYATHSTVDVYIDSKPEKKRNRNNKKQKKTKR